MNIGIIRTTNLDGLILPEPLAGALYMNENQAHRFAISCTKEGQGVALTGSVTGRFIRADGQTVLLTGSVSGGVGYVTLPQACYIVPGRFIMALFNVANGSTTTIYAATGNIARTQTETIIDPGSVIPNIDDLLAEIDAMRQATAAAEAAATKAVRYDSAQSLTDAEMARARGNIGAASETDLTALKNNKAVRYDTTQDLTPAQALQARLNIEAGEAMAVNVAGSRLLDGEMFQRGSLNQGTVTDTQWRVVTTEIHRLPFAITLTAQDGFRFGVNLYTSAGAFSSDSGWQTSYTIPRYSFFRMTIARVTESESETANIAEFVASISAQSQVVREIDIALAGKVAVQQGAANAGKALVVGGDGNVTTGDAVRPDVAQTFTEAQKTTARGNIGAASAAALTALENNKAMRYDITQDLTPAQALKARRNIEAGEAMAVNVAGSRLLDGEMFQRGSLNQGAVTATQWRVVTTEIHRLPFAITLTAQDGFRFDVNLYTSAGAFSSDSGWQTSYTIPRYSFFRMTIARTSESTSETANIADFVASISAQSQVVREIDIALAGKVAVQQGAANAGKALVVGGDGNVTTGDAVRPDVTQTLTDAEMARARGNIGAASVADLAAEAAAREAADSDLKSALEFDTDSLSDRTNLLHSLVNYGYADAEKEANPSASAAKDRLGIKRNGTQCIINLASSASSVLRVKVSGELSVASSNAMTDAWLTGFSLTEGNKYRATLMFESGMVTGDNAIELSIYETGTHVSIGDVISRGNPYVREFTATSTAINIAIYIPSGKTFTNAKYQVILCDITDESVIPLVDETLSVYGDAADAKVTGQVKNATIGYADYLMRGTGLLPLLWYQGNVSTSGVIALKHNSKSVVTDYIPIQNSTKIIYEKSEGINAVRICEYDATKTFLRYNPLRSANTSYTVGNNTSFVVLSYLSAGDDVITPEYAAEHFYATVSTVDKTIECPLGLHTMPKSDGVLNCIKRARQMTDIQWSVASDIDRVCIISGKSYDSPKVYYQNEFVAGRKYTGLPYSEQNLLGTRKGIAQFITSAANPNGKECIDSQYSGDHNVASFFGAVCVTLVSYALHAPMLTSPNYSNMVGLTKQYDLYSNGSYHSIEDIELCDVLWEHGHAAIITDIIRDSLNHVTFVEVSEATKFGSYVKDTGNGDYGGKCRRKIWAKCDFLNWFSSFGVYRYSDDLLDAIPYTPCPYVPMEDEPPYVEQAILPCVPEEGTKSLYFVSNSSQRSVTILISDNSYDYLRIKQNGENYDLVDITNTSSVVVNCEANKEAIYEAYLCNISNGEETSASVSCEWLEIKPTSAPTIHDNGDGSYTFSVQRDLDVAYPVAVLYNTTSANSGDYSPILNYSKSQSGGKFTYTFTTTPPESVVSIDTFAVFFDYGEYGMATTSSLTPTIV